MKETPYPILETTMETLMMMTIIEAKRREEEAKRTGKKVKPVISPTLHKIFKDL